MSISKKVIKHVNNTFSLHNTTSVNRKTNLENKYKDKDNTKQAFLF